MAVDEQDAVEPHAPEAVGDVPAVGDEGERVDRHRARKVHVVLVIAVVDGRGQDEEPRGRRPPPARRSPPPPGCRCRPAGAARAARWRPPEMEQPAGGSGRGRIPRTSMGAGSTRPSRGAVYGARPNAVNRGGDACGRRAASLWAGVRPFRAKENRALLYVASQARTVMAAVSKSGKRCRPQNSSLAMRWRRSTLPFGCGRRGRMERWQIPAASTANAKASGNSRPLSHWEAADREGEGPARLRQEGQTGRGIQPPVRGVALGNGCHHRGPCTEKPSDRRS